MTDEDTGEETKTTAQLSLDGRKLTNKISAHLECKHNKLDEVTKDRTITLYGAISGNNGTIGGFNINLNNVSADQFQDFLDSMGIPKLNRGTPLHLAIFRPDGELLKDWEKEHIPKED